VAEPGEVVLHHGTLGARLGDAVAKAFVDDNGSRAEILLGGLLKPMLCLGYGHDIQPLK
jgi:hypothetical protein